MDEYFRLNSPLYLLLFVPFAVMLLFSRLGKSGKSLILPDGLWISRYLRRFHPFQLVSLLLLSVILASILFYLAGPVTLNSKEVLIPSSSKEGRKIIAVIDTSGSMHARIGGQEDAPVTPFLLSRDMLGAFVDARPSDQFALIIFSSDRSPYLARGFTSNKEQFLGALRGDPADKTSLISQFSESTNIEQALLATISLINPKESYSPLVLLISDLQHNTGPFSEVTEALDELVRRGIKVYILAIYASFTREFVALREYVVNERAVRLFPISGAEDFVEASEAINLLEPSVSPSVATRQITSEERAKPFLFVAIATCGFWGVWQFILRRIP